jgi:hypothetical protein
MRRRDESLLGRGETREGGFQLDSNELAVGARLEGNSLDRATGQRKYGLGARISRSVEGHWLVMPPGSGLGLGIGAAESRR